jgi:DNA-binding protein HU-beta
MTKAELVAEIAERAGLNRIQAKEAIDALIDCVVEAARAGREVRVMGFGAFVPVHRAAGVARNPRTGAHVERPPSRTLRFRPGEALKNALN